MCFKIDMAWVSACLPSSAAGGNAVTWRLQGIKDISVQSSVSLQHLPYNAELETALPKELQSRLAFAKQKVAEIAAAAKASPASSGVSLSKCQPPISEPQPLRLPLLLACAVQLVAMAACHLARSASQTSCSLLTGPRSVASEVGKQTPHSFFVVHKPPPATSSRLVCCSCQ